MSELEDLLKKSGYSLQTVDGLRDASFDVRGQWVHDFQRYIPDEIRSIWGELSDEARVVAFVIAQGVADAEDWE